MSRHDRTNQPERRAEPVHPPRTEAEQNLRPPDMGVAEHPGRVGPRPDPQTGEVRAGPGDAGLSGRPQINRGDPGTAQLSNSRLVRGLGIVAVLVLASLILAALF